jgi:hypothetical protein
MASRELASGQHDRGSGEAGVNRGPDDASGPDHTADQFEAIVAGWRREGKVPAWPGDDRPPTEPPRTPPTAVPPVPPVPAARAHPPEPDPGWDHFVPPEPPPLPRIGPPAVVGISLLALGLTLVVAPSLLGVSDVYGLPLGLLSLASGLGWLVLRLWPAPPDERDEDDDGAQL